MKKLMLAGLLVVSAAAFGNTVTGNEEVSADINFNLRVRQPLALEVIEGNVDFGLMTRGEVATVPATVGNDRGKAVLRGEPASTIAVTFESQGNPNFELEPTFAADNELVKSGETFVLNGNSLEEFGYRTLAFGGTVVVKDDARSGDLTETVTYTFRYQ